MDINEKKIIARKEGFLRRKLAHNSLNPDLIPFVLPYLDNSQVIAAYMPIRTEINPLPLMKQLFDLGKTIAVPVITAEATPLTFAKWEKDTELVEGAFGAAIPHNIIEVVPDTVLAPLVAYDAQGTRLGYGGGFYDRTLEKLRKIKPTNYFALAYSAQKSPYSLPFEKTDIPLDGVFTENGFDKF